MSVHPLQQLDIGRLQQLLDEAETERTRLNRRIRRLRNVIRAAENGDEMPDLAALARQLQRPARVQRAPAAAAAPPTAAQSSAPQPSAPQPSAPQPSAPFSVPTELQTPAPSSPPTPAPGAMTTALGAPVPAHGGSAGALAAPASLPTVDIGHMQRLSDDQLDALPYGVITLDAEGVVLGYNDTESRMVGLPPERVLGRNFFEEVAPCTRVREFEGRFREFAAGNTHLPVETFEFVFQFAKGAQRVLIMFSPARHRGEFFVSLVRR